MNQSVAIIGLLKVIWAWKVYQAPWTTAMIFWLGFPGRHWATEEKKNLFSATNSQQLLKQKPHNVIGTGPRVLGNVKR